MSERAKIGVFVCEAGCLQPSQAPITTGPSDHINAGPIIRSVSGAPNVAYSMQHRFLCSPEAQMAIAKAIRDHGLNRVVVAACSPKLYESTFRKVLETAGLNPFLLEMVNIREQCAWVHPDRREATEKAKRLIGGAVEKARELEEVAKITERVVPRALVIGGGTAGITVAMGLANYNFETYLVEKTAAFGGHAAQLGTVFPTNDCGLCVSPLPLEMHRKCVCKAKLIKHPRIKTLDLAHVKSLTGYPGNFSVKIEKSPRFVDVDRCISCGICEDVCPVEIQDEFNQGLGKKKAIYLPYPHAVPHAYVIDEKSCTKCGKCAEVCPTKAVNLKQKPVEIAVDVGTIVVATGFDEFKPVGLLGYGQYPDVVTQLKVARMLDSSGPTNGKVVRPSDGKTPKRVVVVQCVGSRSPPKQPYCSKICCMISLNQARAMKRKFPEMDVTVCYKDLRLVGKNYEDYHSDCQNLGVRFIKGDVTAVRQDPSGALKVSLDKGPELEADLVVLASALVPGDDTSDQAMMLGANLSPDGFFSEAAPRFSTVDTIRDGIYVCGCCQGPKDIPETINQAMAASAKAAGFLLTGKIEAQEPRATVNKDLCIGCANCEAACPYSAVRIEPPGVARVIQIACKGCGICVAECPMKAIQLENCRDEQLLAQISGILAKEAV